MAAGKPPRGRIHIGKIARLKTLAHERVLPFFKGLMARAEQDRGSTKVLAAVAYAVFHRIHHEFEPVFDFELAID